MAAQRFEKGTEMFFMFQDYWKLIQDFWITEDTDEYWGAFSEAANRFYRKYKTDYAKELVLVLTDELDRHWKNADRRR